MPAAIPIPQRRLLVARVDALLLPDDGGGQPLSLRRACAEAGVSAANYQRWKRQLQEPETGNREPGTTKKPGRPPAVTLTPEQTDRLRFWRLTKGSVPLALEFFLRDEVCTDQLRQFILGRWQKAQAARKRPHWPASIRAALHVTAAEQAAHRKDAKRLQEVTVAERRGAFWINHAGQEVPLLPNSIWESDDESTNEPFRFYDAELGRERVGRQGLYTVDVYSRRFMGGTLVGRSRDAYRVEDIADHFADLARQYGLPLIWRVERGVWENHWLHGLPLSDGSTWGGLGDLVHIATKHSSQAKGNIEGAFNFKQALAAGGWDGGDLTLGRHRGEFPEATRHHQRSQAGREESLRRFAPIDQAADAMAQVLHYQNTRPKVRQMFGGQSLVPDALYKEGQDQARPVPPGEWWRFLPVKRALTIRRGMVALRVDHYPQEFRFRVNGAAGLDGLHLDHGHQVLVAMHPGQPEQGLHLFNADRSKLNRDRLPFGQFLGLAEYLPDRPQEDFSGNPHRPAAEARKRECAGVRRAFRAITSGTAAATRKSYGQDSLGTRLAVASRGDQDTTLDPSRPTGRRGGLIPARRRTSPEPDPDHGDQEDLDALEREAMDLV